MQSTLRQIQFLFNGVITTSEELLFDSATATK